MSAEPPPEPDAAAQVAKTRFSEALDRYRSGASTEARSICAAILETRPEHFGALHLLGTIALSERKFDKSLNLLDRAIALNQFHADAFCSRAIALDELNRKSEALESYDRALGIDPQHFRAHNNRSKTLVDLKMYADALASCDAALKLRPDYAAAHINRGNALRELMRLDDAVASYDRAIASQPDRALGHANRGVALHGLKRFDAAIASYDRALAIDPGFAQARLNKSMSLLLQGDFAAGWGLYEWRRRNEKARSGDRGFAQPMWHGEPSLDGKTILLHAEQGLGDTVQCCRYAKLVADRGARVVLEVAAPLAGLLRGLAGVDELVVRGSPLPAFDYHCPLLSLPLAFDTDPETIPAAPRYLDSDAGLRARWAEKLGERTMPRIGLAWSGNPDHRRDDQRSIPLGTLVRHLPAGLQYVSVQKDLRDSDAATLSSQPGIRHFGEEEIGDFSDTAALCDLMDLVISVDTSVAHLNGALGNPTWILLPFVPDWRWQLDRDDSPWYPGVRLFRQSAPGDWQSVLGRLDGDLKRHFD